MRVLLDTNVLLWWMTGSDRLEPVWVQVISDPRNSIMVSAISAAEISIKTSIGKLPPPPEPLGDAIPNAGFQGLPFTIAHGEVLASLPWHHKDPFDRMIIAQGIVENCPILTADPVFGQYGIQVIG